MKFSITFHIYTQNPIFSFRNLVLHFRRNGSRFWKQGYAVSSLVCPTGAVHARGFHIFYVFRLNKKWNTRVLLILVLRMIKSEWSLVYTEWVTGYSFQNNYCISFSEYRICLSKQGKPDLMSHYAAFYLVLHYLPKYPFRISGSYARLFICALWSPAGKGLTSWLSFVVSNCKFVTFPLVSWVGCGTWLCRLLIFAPLLTYSGSSLLLSTR